MVGEYIFEMGIVNEIKRLGLDLIGVIMNDMRGEEGLVQETNKSFLEDFLVGGVYI